MSALATMVVFGAPLSRERWRGRRRCGFGTGRGWFIAGRPGRWIRLGCGLVIGMTVCREIACGQRGCHGGRRCTKATKDNGLVKSGSLTDKLSDRETEAEAGQQEYR